MASNLPAVTTTGIPERYGSVEYRELRGKYSNALGSEAGLDVLRIESVLALVARANAKFFEDELASLKKILGAKKATPLLANDRTPEEQARINKQVEDAKAQLAAASAARELMEATARADALARAKEANERIILAEYRSLGLKPMRGKTGVLISPSLLKTMGHVVMKSDDQFHAEHDSEARLP